jgi:leucyl aminopeptidase
VNIKYKCEQVNGLIRPATALFLFSGQDSLDDRGELASFRGLAQPHLKSGAFKGGYLDVLPLFQGREGWLLLAGLGPADKFSEARLLEAAAEAASRLDALGLREATLVAPVLAFGMAKTVELMAIGLTLALDERPDYKSKGDSGPRGLKVLTIQAPMSEDGLDRPRNVIARAQVLAQAQLRARNLTDRPANLLTPGLFAQEAVALGQANGLKVTVWDETKLADEGAGAILAVGGGSRNPPRMVILEYQGPKALPSDRPTALVGKGITFDSGGLCLKPAENMHQMKTDMAGAATVLSAVCAAPALRLPGRLVAVIPLAENLPGGSSYRPGDIVATLSGQTVEVMNTDAEGRLILCDALALAQKFQPGRIIDLATLTGACLVALGEGCAGLFCDDQGLSQAIAAAARDAAERFWPMPLLDEYDERLKSDLADFRESGSRAGGAIVGALFLRRFIRGAAAWAHLDIVGTARNPKKRASCPEGATGFGVRTLLGLLAGR